MGEKLTEKVEVDKDHQYEKKERRLLFYTSWTLGVFILVLFLEMLLVCKIDVCKIISNPYFFFLMLLLVIILFLFPFIRRLKIGKLIEIERDIRETREEIKDFKQEIRQTLTLISNLSNVMNVYNVTPGERKEAMKAKQEIINTSNSKLISESEKIKNEFSLMDGEDVNLSLARTRMRIEYLLRIILKKTLIRKNLKKDVKYMSVRRLLDLFFLEYPNHENLRPAFDFVITMANAAVHAQKIPESQASEALDLGSNLIAILEKIINDEGLNFSKET